MKTGQKCEGKRYGARLRQLQLTFFGDSKGFAKIFEAIIASVIILASLTFFFVPNLQMSGWDDNTLQTLSKDALQSVYLNGSLARFVKTDNTTPLIASITDMLPKTVDFSVEVGGIANNIIYLACDCSESEREELVKIFNTTDFRYKSRNISIRIELINLATGTVPSSTDVLFFFDKTKITANQAKIKAFLSSGGTAFLLSDLTQGDVEGTVGSMFNLTWTGTTGSPGEFDDVYNASKLSHYVARYYANISGKYLADTEGDSFPAFNPSGVRVERDDRDIIVTGGGRLYIRGNYKVEGNGRTLWVSDYSRANHNNPPTQSVDRLVKASVMWASGERFKLDTINKTAAPVHFRSSIFVFDEDPYVVDLIVWRVFF